MADVAAALEATIAAIVAIGSLGSASFGLVDASKAFNGGVSNFGFGSVKRSLAPFAGALANANSDWLLTIRANWINGVDKEDQKAAARSLIRLGLSSANARAIAGAGHVDADRLTEVMTRVETGRPLGDGDAEILGRLNGAIDAAMDAGFERGDQQYRNACRLTAGILSVLLSTWAGAILTLGGYVNGRPGSLDRYFLSADFHVAVLVGLIAVPIAPIAKDLASSLQAAANAVQAVRP